MAVNYNKILIYLLFLTVSASCTAAVSQESGNDELIAHLKKRVALATKELGDAIQECEAVAASGREMKISTDSSALQSSTREQLMTGLAHLYFHNQRSCEHAARSALAYEMQTLIFIKKKYGYDAKDLMEALEVLLLPALKELEYELAYQRLPETLTSQLEKDIGGAPFSLKALEELGVFQID